MTDDDKSTSEKPAVLGNIFDLARDFPPPDASAESPEEALKRASQRVSEAMHVQAKTEELIDSLTPAEKEILNRRFGPFAEAEKSEEAQKEEGENAPDSLARVAYAAFIREVFTLRARDDWPTVERQSDVEALESFLREVFLADAAPHVSFEKTPRLFKILLFTLSSEMAQVAFESLAPGALLRGIGEEEGEDEEESEEAEEPSVRATQGCVSCDGDVLAAWEVQVEEARLAGIALTIQKTEPTRENFERLTACQRCGLFWEVHFENTLIAQEEP